VSTRNEHLILSAAMAGSGHHPGAAARSPRALDVAHFRHLVQTAERGLLDFVFLHDERALPDAAVVGRLDALSVLARLAPETSFVGLAVSVPTTYSEPFNVSRALATLDFVSGGRAAWNATSSRSDAEARNFGKTYAPDADERRSLTEEFIEVSRKLWDSWEDDAVITDRERGLYLDPEKLHHINHFGLHFQIRGPQITYRPPQGHPVIVQVDVGDPGTPLSAALADVLILHHDTIEDARRAYAEYKAQATAAGRELRILHSILPILAETEALARPKAAACDAAIPPGASTQPRTLRFVGTPTQLADLLEQWFEAHATDGFHLLPATLPDGLEELTLSLVPELQRRGRFRRAYTGRTLREHLRLPRPASRYAVPSTPTRTIVRRTI
jgi:alkanesulfonate monooxygenase SsuD/methylene tetrahydromethanopterin reductase-like flavin-dependent oxidoreductase (luciferase family)